MSLTAERAREIAVAKSMETLFKRKEELDAYTIQTSLEPDGWHVDFELKPGYVGGGPHYVIDPRSGEVLKTRVYQ